MTKQEFITALSSYPHWKRDHYGHFKSLSETGRTYRIKIGKISWRLERYWTGEYSKGWSRIAGQYYSKTKEIHPQLQTPFKRKAKREEGEPEV